MPRELSTNPRNIAVRVAGERRRNERIWVTTDDQGGGYWFAQYCPPDVHGRAAGPTYWYCQCPPCRDRARLNTANSRKNRVHNMSVLFNLRDGKPAPQPRPPVHHTSWEEIRERILKAFDE